MKPTVNQDEADPGGKYFGQTPDPTKVRRYFLTAEPVMWNYLPSGEDPVMKSPVPPHLLAGKQAVKHRFFQYTDGSFQNKVLPTERLGILGPVMRGRTGEFIVVTLLNRMPFPVSLHAHGVRYDKDSEGSSYFPGRGKGAAIAPGAKFTYVWHLDEDAGPKPNEPSSKPWLYHSHVIGDGEINAGLTGFIIVTDPARSRPDGTPVDVDREMALLFQNYDESGIDETEEYANLAPGAGPPVDPTAGPAFSPWVRLQEKIELGMRHAINGRIFGNLGGLEMREGERVRWYALALGNEADVHTAHWHGARLKDEAGRMMDVLNLMPGNIFSADMKADNPGDWMIHCHVGEHMMEGMYGSYRVLPKNGPEISADPFLGGDADLGSVKWLAVEGDTGVSPFQIGMRCRVSAYENLSVWTTKVGVSISKVRSEVLLDKEGFGESEGVSFRVLNADSIGLVRGDFLEIELKMTGENWKEAMRDEITRTAGKSLSASILLNGVSHATVLPPMPWNGTSTRKQ